ncbi:Flp family type IVb pilin [Qipengyuania sp. MTN3-11]|uniref:Flp family type IVb pilin n=1 Tax=Qipengyuania sp. MTN3-11 TaxID=3056557 RepID=UPI0036F1A3F0
MRDETGATAVEYGLILALVFLAMLGAVQAFGQNATTMWNDTSETINEASSATR